MPRFDYFPAIPPDADIEYFPATRERKNSFLAFTVPLEVAIALGCVEQCVSADQKKVKILLKDSGKILGEGKESSVRQFDMGKPDGLRAAVASPCSRLPSEDLLVEYAKEKQKFTNHVYGKNFAQGFFYQNTYRLVMPVFRGVTLLQAMEIAPQKVKTCLATLIQALAKAMQSVHELGIVHGDFKADNAFIGNDPETLETIAWLIDFGFAQKIGKKVEKFPDIVYWPPEKTTKLEEELLADTSQDIYGLADMIQRILQSFKLESNKTIFHDWCNTAKQDDPSLRPSLQSLIEIIDLYLAQTKLLHQLKTPLKELIKTITQKISLAPPGAKDTLHFRMLFLKNLDRYLSQIGVGLKYLPNDKKSIQVQILYLIGQNIDKLTPSLKKFIEARNKNQLCKLVDNDLDTILRQVPDGLQPTLTYNA